MVVRTRSIKGSVGLLRTAALESDIISHFKQMLAGCALRLCGLPAALVAGQHAGKTGLMRNKFRTPDLDDSELIRDIGFSTSENPERHKEMQSFLLCALSVLCGLFGLGPSLGSRQIPRVKSRFQDPPS